MKGGGGGGGKRRRKEEEEEGGGKGVSQTSNQGNETLPVVTLLPRFQNSDAGDLYDPFKVHLNFIK